MRTSLLVASAAILVILLAGCQAPEPFVSVVNFNPDLRFVEVRLNNRTVAMEIVSADIFGANGARIGEVDFKQSSWWGGDFARDGRVIANVDHYWIYNDGGWGSYSASSFDHSWSMVVTISLTRDTDNGTDYETSVWRWAQNVGTVPILSRGKEAASGPG